MKNVPLRPPLAGFHAQGVSPAVPASGSSGSDVPLTYPISLPTPYAPSAAGSRPKPQMPEGSFIELEYYCVSGRAAAVTALAWADASLTPITLPRMTLKAIIPRIEEIRRKPEVREPKSPVEVLPIAKPRKIGARRLLKKQLPASIAAAVIVALSIWFGSRALTPPPIAQNQDVRQEYPLVHPGAQGSGHLNPVAWAKTTIEKRATVQVTDTFKQGMANWGAPKGWVPGWSRHPDGYVRPGKLALFQPTSSFTDYRLEFFGQVENRGMGWAVRARDPSNYYAMKFRVLESGLRPLLEMIYYPVVGGKPGHQVKVKLPAVMIHANTPYHVAVKVSGNHLTASVEGQEVDSWTDEVEPSGAVGFFMEPGERARLYWMKVFKNDDWLGRVCAFLTGNSVEEPVNIAWLNPPNTPLPSPGERQLLRLEPVLLVRGTDFLPFDGFGRTGAAGKERIPTWNF